MVMSGLSLSERLGTCTLAPTHDSGKCRRLLFDHRAHVGEGRCSRGEACEICQAVVEAVVSFQETF